jgi:hypothetical protein
MWGMRGLVLVASGFSSAATLLVRSCSSLQEAENRHDCKQCPAPLIIACLCMYCVCCPAPTDTRVEQVVAAGSGSSPAVVKLSGGRSISASKGVVVAVEGPAAAQLLGSALQVRLPFCCLCLVAGDLLQVSVLNKHRCTATKRCTGPLRYASWTASCLPVN